MLSEQDNAFIRGRICACIDAAEEGHNETVQRIAIGWDAWAELGHPWHIRLRDRVIPVEPSSEIDRYGVSLCLASNSAAADR